MKRKTEVTDSHSWKLGMEVVNYKGRYSNISTSTGIGTIEGLSATRLRVKFGSYEREFYRDGRPYGGGTNWDYSELRPATQAHRDEVAAYRKELERKEVERGAHDKRQKDLVAAFPNASASIPCNGGQVEIRFWFDTEDEARKFVESAAKNESAAS